MGEMDQSNYTKDEAKAIYSTIENRATERGTSENAQIQEGIYGYGIRGNLSKKEFATKAKVATAGTVEAMTDKTDFSGGAFWWQGRDIRMPMEGSHAYESYYKTGLEFTNQAHDFWNMGSNKSGNKKYDYQWETTGFYGRTTFLRYSDDYRRATGKGERKYP